MLRALRKFDATADKWWHDVRTRTRIGVTLTTAWVGIVLGSCSASTSSLIELGANEWGDLIAGVCAPPAFFWLIVGYFQQSEELGLQRRELALQREEVARLANEAQKQTSALEEEVRLHRLERHESAQPRFAVQVEPPGSNKDMVTLLVANRGGRVRNLRVEALGSWELRVNRINTKALDTDDQAQIILADVPRGIAGLINVTLYHRDDLGRDGYTKLRYDNARRHAEFEESSYDREEAQSPMA